MQREHGQRVRADLVGEVAVRRDAVGADDHEVHLRLAHQRARDGVGNDGARDPGMPELPGRERSEEHTSELQSPCNLVCRLLLEKKIQTWIILAMASPKPSQTPCRNCRS